MGLIIDDMDKFQSICKKHLVDYYNEHHYNEDNIRIWKSPKQKINMSNVFVVWSVKALQNFKALLSTTVDGDGCYVEFTYNGDKQELYMDFYGKISNTCIKESINDYSIPYIIDENDLDKARCEFYIFLYDNHAIFNPNKSAKDNGITKDKYPNLLKYYDIIIQDIKEYDL